MAGGEPRLGTDSMYMGNHNSLLCSLQPIICQLHGYTTRTSENKIARYQPLDVKERRKLRLATQGHLVNRKRVQRLMRLIGLVAIYQRPNTSKAAAAHKVYPDLLGGLAI